MPVAQPDRAFPSEGKGRAFESHQARFYNLIKILAKKNFFSLLYFLILIFKKKTIAEMMTTIIKTTFPEKKIIMKVYL
ncbi:unknown [Fusobacterium sp. CAG:439]|nr:unknown [Fusobacterium sp. CAG:439]